MSELHLNNCGTFGVYNMLSAKLLTSAGEFSSFDQNSDWQDLSKAEMTTHELQCRFGSYSQSFKGLGLEKRWGLPAWLCNPTSYTGCREKSDTENLQYCFHVVSDDSFSLQKVREVGIQQCLTAVCGILVKSNL